MAVKVANTDANEHHDNRDVVLKVNNKQESEALIRKYLDTLDKYQTAQADLSMQFIDGYLNLARANYSDVGNVGNVRRYGKAFYDERVKAIIKVSLKNNQEISKCRVDSDPSLNPIIMFGILVPTSLRQAQQCFSAGVDDVIRIVNLKRELNALEGSIIKLKTSNGVPQ